MTIYPMKFQIWNVFSVPRSMNLPVGSTLKKHIPLIIMLCFIKSNEIFLLLSFASLEASFEINPNEILPFYGLSSEML